LGDEKSSREHVENFYQFWFAFDSWRTFEYLDEEDTDKSGSREEKRWLDKKNIASRKKNKKEDIQRLNRLIEQAFALDPRIKEFKAQDKYEKDAKKREKEAAAKAEAEAAANAAEIARLKEEKEAEIAKEASKKAKEEKESAKNAIKKERKTIRRIMRDSNNFLPKDSSAEHILVHTEKIEFILASGDVGYLEQVRLKFESVMNFGVEHLELVLEDEHHFLNSNYKLMKCLAILCQSNQPKCPERSLTPLMANILLGPQKRSLH
jgi:DnaJ family protein C protein 2